MAKIELIDKIKDVLRNEWGKVHYSQNEIDYNPRLKYSLDSDYEIYARRIWIAHKECENNAFEDKLTSYLISAESSYIPTVYSEEADDYICERDPDATLAESIAKKICELCRHDKKTSNDKSNIRKTEIELIRTYGSHCCDTLNQTDNAEERYFPRLSIVYVPPINTYVLTNNRKYIYVELTKTYVLDQSLKYEILDFCPFCGIDLRSVRVKSGNKNRLIIKYINKWREEGVGKIGPYKTKWVLTRYGINCYDSYSQIADILSSNYAEFNNLFGVDPVGNIYEGAKFITVDRLFDIANKYAFFENFDIDQEEFPEGISNEKIIEWFRNQFNNKVEFEKKYTDILRGILFDILWAMFHKPQCFDELLESCE
jgi:hypothetical protein